MTDASPLTGCPCGRVDVHSHFLPDCYSSALRGEGLLTLDGGIPVPSWSVKNHLETMDGLGIEVSLLSISSPGLHFLDRDRAVRLARQINEEAAALVLAHPGRFGAFATLPLQDVAASIDEIAYALDTLKLDGVALETNSRGLYLGDARFRSLFDELDRRGAVVFLHPTSPECLDSIGMGFPGPLLEFPFDTARSVLSLIYNGVLHQRRNVRLILSHAGGALPSLVSRMAYISDVSAISPRPKNGSAEVYEEVGRLYFDLALAATPLNFQSLLEITSPSNILFGTDYPFAPPPIIARNCAGFEALMHTLPPDDRERIERGNALDLFPRLKSAAAP